MKKFFKNPYNIALLSIIGLFVLSVVFAQFWEMFISISVLIVSLFCFYFAFYMYIKFKKQQSKVDVDEFFSNESLQERKKKSFLEQESKVNKALIIYGLIFFGIMMFYLFIKML